MRVAQRKNNGKQRTVEFYVVENTTLSIQDGVNSCNLQLSMSQAESLIDVLQRNIAREREHIAYYARPESHAHSRIDL